MKEIRKFNDYNIRPTGPDSSYNNALVDIPLQRFSASIRKMLDGNEMRVQIWNYSFNNFIRVNIFQLNEKKTTISH